MEGSTMPLGKDDVAFLESMDTPTVCNVIEIVAPERRGHGYTTRHLHCAFPDLPPMVGFAKTVTMCAKDPVPLGDVHRPVGRRDRCPWVQRPADSRVSQSNVRVSLAERQVYLSTASGRGSWQASRVCHSAA
jgi:hypothetical protein